MPRRDLHWRSARYARSEAMKHAKTHKLPFFFPATVHCSTTTFQGKVREAFSEER